MPPRHPPDSPGAKLTLAMAELHQELQPRPVPESTPFSRPGWTHRVSKAIERAWPMIEPALREAMDICYTREPDALVNTLARVLWNKHRRAHAPEEEQLIIDSQHARLLSLMESEGLPFAMACAVLALDPKLIQKRCENDPVLASKIGMAFIRGTASLHKVVWQKAIEGDTRSALRLLEIRDKSYIPTINVDLSVQTIVESEAFQRLSTRLLAVFNLDPPEDMGEDERRGWALAMETARIRFAESVRE